jgi:hypothetical protein
MEEKGQKKTSQDKERERAEMREDGRERTKEDKTRGLPLP